MPQKIRDLGTVKLVQLQPKRMIVEGLSLALFDCNRRKEFPQIQITADGVSAYAPNGDPVLDVHHTKHPETRFKSGNSLSIGFSAHYKAMRARFGSHIADGTAGENVLIDFRDEVWLDYLGKHLLFENPETGLNALLDVNRIAKPCSPFGHFVSASPYTELPTFKLKEVLRFLDNGRRGFLLSLNESQTMAFIKPGDKVSVVTL